MHIFKVFCFIILGMLLILANAKAKVYDDEGKVITEKEIRDQMQSIPGDTYGCCFLGLLSGSLSSIALSMSVYMYIEEDEEGAMGIGFLAGAVGAIFGSYFGWQLGESLDRKTAIKSIKEQRRNQKQNEDRKSLGPDIKLVLPLMLVKF